jgi:ubiquinone biosynthesis protein
MGSLSDFDQYYLARNLLAIFQRRYREVAELHIECGWVPPGTRVQDFESAIRATCEPIFEKPLGEISFGQLLVYLFQTARRFDMEVQPSLVLLQKTLLHIEGLGRQLYPQLDLWATAKPFLEQWVADRYSPKVLLERLQRRAPGWLEQLPHRPELLGQGLDGLLRHTPPPPPRETPGLRRGRSGWRTWQLGIAAAGILLLNPSALEGIGRWHPATWAFIALGAYALMPRRRDIGELS